MAGWGINIFTIAASQACHVLGVQLLSSLADVLLDTVQADT